MTRYGLHRSVGRWLGEIGLRVDLWEKKQNAHMNESHQFGRFTRRAQKVLSLAQEEAQRLRHHSIGTEHLLLGLVREGGGIGGKVLIDLGVDLETARKAVEGSLGRGTHIVVGEIGLTSQAKQMIELTIDEAQRLNHSSIGTEHLLLGWLREGEGSRSRVLESFGLSSLEVQAKTLQILNEQRE